MPEDFHPCAFCADKFQHSCQVCPEWPEELLDEERMTAEFIAERVRLTQQGSFVPPLSN